MIAPNGTVYVDNTTLASVARCTTQAALRHGLGYTVHEDAHQLEVGIAAHEVLADYLKGKDASYCLSKYELLYRGYSQDAGLDHPYSPFYRLSWTNTDAILRQWFETHPLGGFSFSVNPKLVEVGFQLPLSDECVCGHAEADHGLLKNDPDKCGIWDHNGPCTCKAFVPAYVFQGRLDAIVQASHDNSLYVLDHKTTGRIAPYWTEKFRNDSQMTGYVWAAQQTLGQPVVGVFINGIEFSKLPTDPVRKCRLHGVPYAECGPLHAKSELLIYTRSPDQLEQWRLDAVRLAKRYRNILTNLDMTALTDQPMEGTFTNACGFCNFNKFCQAGRPEQYISSMLTYSPWRPFTEEEKPNG